MTGRDPGEVGRAATPLELLFDLTFVVAVAQAAGQLHDGLAAGHVGHALAGYAVVFFGLWWAWVNFTWFASAYDTDDAAYRVLTLLQMGGVLVFAAGVPREFTRFDFTVLIAGYVIMRIALATQWCRASAAHPAGRAGTLRYAAGVTVVQLCWIGWLWLPGVPALVGLVVLIAAELAVPVWAEFTGRTTPWHPGHIGERYGLFTIIVLGEVIAAIATVLESAFGDSGVSLSLLVTAVAGLLLVFALWWAYFEHSVTEAIRHSLPSTFAWALAHYFVFAAVAGLGAGLEVVVDVLTHPEHVGAVFAAFTVAVPVALFLVVLGLLTTRLSSEPTATGLVMLIAVLVLATAAAAGMLPLPLAIVIMMLLVAVLVAYHVLPARRPERKPSH
jgi:low temperature requirement protein LtrA